MSGRSLQGGLESSLRCLTQLTDVNLNGNDLRSLQGLGVLHNLSSLRARCNQLTCALDFTVTSPLGSQLRYADCGENQIEQLTCSDNDGDGNDGGGGDGHGRGGVASHPKLEALIIDRNRLTSLRGLEEVRWLRVLDARQNELSTVEALQHLPALTSINLSHNRLEGPFSSVARCVRNTNRLQHLWLEGNALDIPIGHGVQAVMPGREVNYQLRRGEEDAHLMQAYRLCALCALPALLTLDGGKITCEERIVGEHHHSAEIVLSSRDHSNCVRETRAP